MTRQYPRAMFFETASPLPMLRGPQVFYSPSEGADPEPEPAAEPEPDPTPEEFREQPGDREPEAEPEPEPAAEPEPAPEPEPAAEGEAEPEPEPAQARQTDWKDRQIAKLREREKADKDALAEVTRRAEAAEALLAATPEEREAGITDAQRETIRKEEAAKLANQHYYERLNTGLEKMDAAGKGAFAATWEDRVAQVRDAMSDEIKARPDFLEAVTDLPNAAQVYHELAGDLDKMDAILKLPAHKMGMELARLSDKLAKPPTRQVSKVPAPIVPIERGGTERDLEDLINDPKADMAEINRRMSAEERKRAAAAAH